MKRMMQLGVALVALGSALILASLSWACAPMGFASSGETRLAGLTGEGLGLALLVVAIWLLVRARL